MDATRSPGWYPAPDGNGQQWWNGAGWSESRQGATASIPRAAHTVSQPAAPNPAPAVSAAAPKVVYSASNPAPQYPGQEPTLGAQIPAAMQIDARANPDAFYALVAGIGAIVFNLLLVPSILAIVFALRAFTRAKKLAAEGKENTLRGVAVVGLSLGIFGGVIGVVPVIAFVFSIVASIVSAMAGAAG